MAACGAQDAPGAGRGIIGPLFRVKTFKNSTADNQQCSYFSSFEDNIRFALTYTPIIACLESKSKFVKSTEGKQQML